MGNGDVGVGVSCNSIHDFRKVGISSSVLVSGHVWVYVLEESQRCLVDSNASTGFPLGYGVIQKFCCCCGDEVPVKLVMLIAVGISLKLTMDCLPYRRLQDTFQ